MNQEIYSARADLRPVKKFTFVDSKLSRCPHLGVVR